MGIIGYTIFFSHTSAFQKKQIKNLIIFFCYLQIFDQLTHSSSLSVAEETTLLTAPFEISSSDHSLSLHPWTSASQIQYIEDRYPKVEQVYPSLGLADQTGQIHALFLASENSPEIHW